MQICSRECVHKTSPKFEKKSFAKEMKQHSPISHSLSLSLEEEDDREKLLSLQQHEKSPKEVTTH